MFEHSDIFKDVEVCNDTSESFWSGGTLEKETCMKVYGARNELMDAYNNTRHENRDTQGLRSVLKNLDFIIKANTKMEE